MQHVLIVKTELSHRDNQFNPIQFFFKSIRGKQSLVYFESLSERFHHHHKDFLL